MNTLRGFIDPRHYLPSRRHPRGSLAATRRQAARAWWSRFLASTTTGRRPSPAPALTLVLWSSSVEGMTADDRTGESVN